MTDAERSELGAVIAACEETLDPNVPVVLSRHDVDRVFDAEEAKVILVTDLLLSKAAATTTVEQARAKGEAFRVALEGVSAWAVDRAIAAWHRGDVPDAKPEDLKWAPDTATLRRLALRAEEPYRERLGRLVNVRDARPIEELL